VAIYIPPSPNPDTSAPASAAAGGQTTFLECARTLYRRKATLSWIAGFGLIAAALLSLAQPRMYRSQASVQIQGVNENFLNLRDIYPTAAPSAENAIYVQTQAEMLQQDALLEQVAGKLHLAGSVEQLRKNLQIVPSRASSIIRIVAEAREPQQAADIANTLAQSFIDQSIEARQRAAQQTHAALALDLDRLRGKLLRPETGASRRAAREDDGSRQFYEALSRQAEEASVASTLRQSNIRLVGAAQPAAHPYRPNVPLNLAFGLFAGLALGIGYVMLEEQTHSGLRVPGEAGAYLTLPELGAIPKAEGRRFAAFRVANPASGKLQVERASLEQPVSALSESFRSTLASILSANQSEEQSHVLVITSALPTEGKTTVVSNLGIALAEIGLKVLLIDGDLRRPRLHKVFDQINSWGLSDLLREKNAIEDLPLEVLVKKTGVPRLSLLSGGTCTDNIFGLLCSGRMAWLLARFRQEFDYVLVDAPPCLEFADARIMARHGQKLLLVVRAGNTDRKTAQAAVQRLQLDGIAVMGVIFNYWDPAHSDSYDYARYRQEVQ
jgi:receptor protein-tyrosine kinase